MKWYKPVLISCRIKINSTILALVKTNYCNSCFGWHLHFVMQPTFELAQHCIQCRPKYISASFFSCVYLMQLWHARRIKISPFTFRWYIYASSIKWGSNFWQLNFCIVIKKLVCNYPAHDKQLDNCLLTFYFDVLITLGVSPWMVCSKSKVWNW